MAFFHQIRIPQRDRDFGRFYWFEDGNIKGDAVEYRLTKHLFRGIASQCCAVMALNHCLRKQVPDRWTKDITESTVKSFYSDDCMQSFPTRDEAIPVMTELISVLKVNGFTLDKFRSNDSQTEEILRSNKATSPMKTVGKALHETKSALSILWNVKKDQLMFSLPQEVSDIKWTKRGVLSFLMAIYDPLGLMVPFIIPLKLFFQKLIAKCEWDDALDEEQRHEFAKCISIIQKMETIPVQR